MFWRLTKCMGCSDLGLFPKVVSRKVSAETFRRLSRIEGRVQGVWFRESTRREATALGITGYAKNMAVGNAAT